MTLLDQRVYDTRHKMLTQRTLFVLRVMGKRYAESAFCDACHTSSVSGLIKVNKSLTISGKRGTKLVFMGTFKALE